MLDVALGGRGFFIWILFRSLSHALGWPATIAVIVALAVGAGLARQHTFRRD